jgi:hypothetical protein
MIYFVPVCNRFRIHRVLHHPHRAFLRCVAELAYFWNSSLISSSSPPHPRFLQFPEHFHIIPSSDVYGALSALA